ncbi:MAG: hypothetical protein WCD79_10865 [Chthoniobacteraceae bacterium]
MEGDDIVSKHEEDGRRNAGDSPESTAANLRRFLETGGARSPFGFSAQQIAIERWARESGRWFEWPAISDGTETGGVEHFVKALPEEGRILKITIPPAFGRTPIVTSSNTVQIREATPLEYLDRWRLHGGWFGDEVEILGATMKHDGFPSFVISQRFIEGEPPSYSQLCGYLGAFGFLSVPGTPIFYNGMS